MLKLTGFAVSASLILSLGSPLALTISDTIPISKVLKTAHGKKPASPLVSSSLPTSDHGLEPVYIPPSRIKALTESVCPLYGVDPALMQTIARQESNLNRNASRFEPRIYAKLKDRDLSTSWGIYQVMGHNAQRHHVKIKELLDEEVATELACKMMRDCLSYHKGEHFQIAKALECWNGSKKYASKVSLDYLKS